MKKSSKKSARKKNWLSSRNSGLIVLVLLLLLGLISPAARDNVAEALNLTDIFTPHKPLASKVKGPLTEGFWEVVRVVDGDTLRVRDSAGTEYPVRLIGADTPEVVKPNTPVEPFGHEASEFTKRKIAEANHMVRIAFDGDQVDKYNRSLAMVYLPMPDGTEVWLNELLIREGLARAQLQYRYSKGTKEAFRNAETEAKNAKRNIWSLP
jgi:micrococcal nuclease